MSELSQYLSSVSSAVRRQDGAALARSLALPAPLLLSHATSSSSSSSSSSSLAPREIALVAACRGNKGLANACLSALGGDSGGLDAVVAHRLRTIVAVVDADWAEANKSMLVMYNTVVNVFREGEGNWLIPLLSTASSDLRLLAAKSDDAVRNRDSEFLRDALRNLTNGFNVVAKERAPFTDPDSKRLALFAVTNVLFKIYFKLNTLQLCSKLINVVERPGAQCATDAYWLFPVSDVVTYKYYVGRLKMFEDKYEEARDCFLFALRHTPRSHSRDVQRILVNLVPVQMCLGIMPGPAVGSAGISGSSSSTTSSSGVCLSELRALGLAVVAGDVRRFEQIMKANQRRFIMLGIYLVLEQVKVICYRNLFKKVYEIAGSTRLRLELFSSALSWLGVDMEADEVECVLANLVFQGKIKGYLSHEKRTLIVSKADPFPTSAIVKKPPSPGDK